MIAEVPMTCDRCGCEITADDQGQMTPDCVVCERCCRVLLARAREARRQAAENDLKRFTHDTLNRLRDSNAN